MLRRAASAAMQAASSSLGPQMMRLSLPTAARLLMPLRAHAASAAPASAPAPAESAPQILNFGVQGEGVETITTVSNLGGSHHVRLDEPKFLGGKDTAANPVEYLLASLVGCIQVTLHVVAAEEGVQLGKVSWHADGDVDLRGLLGVPGVFPGFQRITVTARVATAASPDALEALCQKVLVRCPVGNTIKAPGVAYTLAFVKA